MAYALMYFFANTVSFVLFILNNDEKYQVRKYFSDSVF